MTPTLTQADVDAIVASCNSYPGERIAVARLTADPLRIVGEFANGNGFELGVQAKALRQDARRLMVFQQLRWLQVVERVNA